LTKKERKIRFEALAEYGCVVCMRPAEIHHLIGHPYSSMGKKANDINTIPLCVDHHRGSQGIHHMGMRVWEQVYGSQEYLLNKTNENLTFTN
jgi:hypothetical protein|tara:strand:- start:211 stop:486 length:276 start_codon:yes stop_codon:yes gene_type:complete